MTVGPDEARKQGRSLIREQDCDDKHRNLFKLIEGRLAAWIYCDMATDVAPAIQIAKEHGFLKRTVFVLGSEAYRAASELKAAGRPVVLPAELVHQQRDPITGQLRETFIPKVIYDAGLQFALQPNERGSMGERYLGYQAARCVREGIPRQVALESITLNPARMLGVSDQLGSLEVGKAAYIQVLSGDPLDFNSWVEKAYIRGVLAYDRKLDVRLDKLLGLEQQPESPSQDAAAEQPKPAKEQASAKPPAAKDQPADQPSPKEPEGAPPKKKDEPQPQPPSGNPDGEEL